MDIKDMKRVMERQLGFETYNYLIKNRTEVDKPEYQKKFDDYYKVRRDKKWREKYFKIFKQHINDKEPNYDSIIDDLYDELPLTKKGKKRVEASFASKMLATINPEMPILDSNVLKNMGLSKDGIDSEESLEKSKKVYKTICDRYEDFFQHPDYQTAEKLYNECFPDYTYFSKAKKTDWFMYSMSLEELEKAGIFSKLIKRSQEE